MATIDNIVNGRLLAASRRVAGPWELPATRAEDVALALKVARKKTARELAEVIAGLEAIGREASWLSPADYDEVIQKTGTTRKFLNLSIGRINRWLANLSGYVGSLGECAGPGLRRGKTVHSGGLPTALILAGDATSLAPFGIAHCLLANASLIVKGSAVEPLSPYLFCRAVMAKGLPAPALLYFDTSSEADRGLIRQLVSSSSQAVIFGEDRTVQSIYRPIPFDPAHKPVPYWSGRSAAVVLEDADLAQAAKAIVYGATEDRGNRCVNTKKVFLPESLAGDLEPLLIREAEALVRGDPLNPATDIGGLEEPARRMVEAAAAECEVLYDRDLFIVRAPDSSALLREELPHPVLALRTYRRGEDPIELSNRFVEGTASRRTLSLALFTRSEEAFVRAAPRAATFRIVWNGATTNTDLTLPHQGMHLFLELLRTTTCLS